MHKLVATFLVALMLAGCAAPLEDTDGQDQAARYDALEAAIGTPITENPEDSVGVPTEYNLERVARVTGTEGRTALPTEGYVETAVKDGYAYLCRSGPEQGLVIFDVHDVEHPVQVGFIALDAGFEPDIEVSDDGNWAFWETQRFPTSAPGPNVLEPGANLPHGIHIIDISDKTDPTWAGFTPVTPDGPHSITYANIGGRDIVFASTYAFAYAYADTAVPTAQRLIIYELDTSLPTAQLVQLAEYVDEDYAEPAVYPAEGGQFPHDVSVGVHPVTGQTLAYVAYWDLGVVILDVDDPAHPVKIGQALDFGAAPTNEIHMARASETLIDGRVVLVAEPEISGQETTGFMSIIDITDPTAPAFLSNWRIPGEATSGGGSRGPHYFDFRDGRVVLASYAAGFWVFDVHDHDNLLRPRTVAYALMTDGGDATNVLGGSAFDAWWADPHHVVASESSGGMVVFRYTGPDPAIDTPWLG